MTETLNDQFLTHESSELDDQPLDGVTEGFEDPEVATTATQLEVRNTIRDWGTSPDPQMKDKGKSKSGSRKYSGKGGTSSSRSMRRKSRSGSRK